MEDVAWGNLTMKNYACKRGAIWQFAVQIALRLSSYAHRKYNRLRKFGEILLEFISAYTTSEKWDEKVVIYTVNNWNLPTAVRKTMLARKGNWRFKSIVTSYMASYILLGTQNTTNKITF